MSGRLAPMCLLLAVLGCAGGSQQESGSPIPEEEAASFGRFEGEVVGVWSPNGRDMTLREDFVYIDPRQKRWEAPSGSVVSSRSSCLPGFISLTVIGSPACIVARI